MGKKIVSMNAVKHGMYSSPSLESMAVLQENPLEYVKLLAGLIGSFHPRSGWSWSGRSCGERRKTAPPSTLRRKS